MPLPTTAIVDTFDAHHFVEPHGDSHSSGGGDPVTDVYYAGGRKSVTQLTSITTGVTCHARRGTITTVALALAAAAEAEFTVTSVYCNAEDVVVICVKSGPSDNEHVMPFISSVSDGSFTVVLTNLAAANQADGAIVLNFAILSGTNN